MQMKNLTASSASPPESDDAVRMQIKMRLLHHRKLRSIKGLTAIDADDAVNFLLRIKVVEHRK